ncbi:MAG: hypothetical protein AAF799_39235 [Myxococcota bacterium]
MLSLPQVLHEAQRHAVTEIAIEPGQPVTFHGDQGALVLGDMLEEQEISEALTLVLAPDQMAELAVANIVEFHIGGFSEWNFVAETGEDGVMIRGRIRDGSVPDEYGVPLELPPLEPFEYERTSEIPRSSGSVLRQNEPRETRWDLAAAGAVSQDIDSAPSASIEDPSLVNPDDPPTVEPEAEAPPPPQGENGGLIDFALVGRTAPTSDLPEMEPSLATTAPRLSGFDPVSVQTTMQGEDTLGMHVDALLPGTVIHLAGLGAGERLFRDFDGAYEVIDDATWATATSRPLTEIPLGQAYLVRLEDPSRCLPWLLRRLEEGACLVIETRARTVEGARRVLLGAEASSHLVGWLDVQEHWWLHPEGAVWTLDSV